jgi:NADPH-dependent curcumin reductase CurA
LIESLGYHAAVNYKTANLKIALDEVCSDGIDIFFDNVGGTILDTALTRLRHRARVVVCGAISQINASEPPAGPRNYLQLLAKSARMEGFTTFDFGPRYGEARSVLASWTRAGRLRYHHEIVEGLHNAPSHLFRLFDGRHRGKLMVKLADPEV